MVILYGKNFEKRRDERNYQMREDGRVFVYIEKERQFKDAIFSGNAQPPIVMYFSPEPDKQIVEANSLFEHMIAQIIEKCENGQSMQQVFNNSEGVPSFVFDLEEEVYGNDTNFKLEFLKAYEKVALEHISKIRDDKTARIYFSTVRDNIATFNDTYNHTRENIETVKGIFAKEINE